MESEKKHIEVLVRCEYDHKEKLMTLGEFDTFVDNWVLCVPVFPECKNIREIHIDFKKST